MFSFWVMVHKLPCLVPIVDPLVPCAPEILANSLRCFKSPLLCFGRRRDLTVFQLFPVFWQETWLDSFSTVSSVASPTQHSCMWECLSQLQLINPLKLSDSKWCQRSLLFKVFWGLVKIKQKLLRYEFHLEVPEFMLNLCSVWVYAKHACNDVAFCRIQFRLKFYGLVKIYMP